MGREYCITKARVRFKVLRLCQEEVTAELYEFDFHGASWVSPDGHNDPDDAWDYESKSYDNKIVTSASCTIFLGEPLSNSTLTPYLELTLSEMLKCDKISFSQV